METVTLTVKGMTCMGCVRSVKNVVEPLPGVSGVEITLDNGQVVVNYDPVKTPLEQIKNAIDEAGYEVVG
jgi:copper chaperone